MIKLLAVDLDDTLLSEDLTISHENVSALSAAAEQGVQVVLASGRTLFSMEPYARELRMMGNDGYMICNNGSSVVDTSEGHVIFTKSVSLDAAVSAWEIVRRHGLTMQYYGHGVIYSSGTNRYTDRDCLLTGQRMELIRDFSSALGKEQMKFVIPGDPVLLQTVQGEIQEAIGPACNVLISKPYFLEILPGGADKSTALEFIANALGISPGEVMAIGDSMNDHGMITWAGTGVAMKNAIKDVRMAADAVTPLTHNESGVAWAVMKYILSGAEALKITG